MRLFRRESCRQRGRLDRLTLDKSPKAPFQHALSKQGEVKCTTLHLRTLNNYSLKKSLNTSVGLWEGGGLYTPQGGSIHHRGALYTTGGLYISQGAPYINYRGLTLQLGPSLRDLQHTHQVN